MIFNQILTIQEGRGDDEVERIIVQSSGVLSEVKFTDLVASLNLSTATAQVRKSSSSLAVALMWPMVTIGWCMFISQLNQQITLTLRHGSHFWVMSDSQCFIPHLLEDQVWIGRNEVM